MAYTASGQWHCLGSPPCLPLEVLNLQASTAEAWRVCGTGLLKPGMMAELHLFLRAAVRIPLYQEPMDLHTDLMTPYLPPCPSVLPPVLLPVFLLVVLSVFLPVLPSVLLPVLGLAFIWQEAAKNVNSG